MLILVVQTFRWLASPASGNVLEVYLSPMMTNLFFNLRLDYLKRNYYCRTEKAE